MTSFQRWAPRRERSTTSSFSDFLTRPEFSERPAATFSYTDIVGNGFGAWKTIPTIRRTFTGSMPLA